MRDERDRRCSDTEALGRERSVVDTGVAATIDGLLPERLANLRRASGLPVVFGGSIRHSVQGRRLDISRLLGTLGTGLRGLTVPSGRGLGGEVLRHGAARRVNGYADADGITHEYDDIVVREERITSVFAVPVTVHGTVHAVFYGAVRDGAPIGDRAMGAAAVVAERFQQDLELLLPTRRDDRPTLSALDELADIIEHTEDSGLRSRLLRIHRELGGGFSGAGDAREVSVAVRLTSREVDVLRHAAVGASNVEIAAELGLSVQTVKAYLRSAMRKLGVRNRTAAVHAARLSGNL
ncbi:LuxR C-terminal-related transcriptional regulator [Streptomyces sp. NPDC057694]|uniref:helix-turn-helix transcriptional regulator n=1 Tax=Streptomyces sp. NPDC057694 TaxID=3346216 RepID=UPI0036BD62E2